MDASIENLIEVGLLEYVDDEDYFRVHLRPKFFYPADELNAHVKERYGRLIEEYRRRTATGYKKKMGVKEVQEKIRQKVEIFPENLANFG